MSNEGIKDKYNRIGIATSGENESDLKVSYYYALKNQKATKLKVDGFIELDKLQQIVENETLEIEKEALLNYRTKLNDYFDFEYFNKIEVKNRPLFFAVLLLMKNKIKQFLDEEEYVKIYKNNVYLKDEFDNLQQDKIEPEKKSYYSIIAIQMIKLNILTSFYMILFQQKYIFKIYLLVQDIYYITNKY